MALNFNYYFFTLTSYKWGKPWNYLLRGFFIIKY